MSEEKDMVQELKHAVIRSRRSQAFLKSDLWGEVYDMLAAKQEKIKMEVLWAPTTEEFDPSRVAMKVAFASGRDYEIGELLRIFQRWDNEGQEAAEKLKEMGAEI